MPSDVRAVANAFIAIAKANGEKITNLQVQKLVYIAHGYHLAIYGKPLFEQEVKAWDYGPVIPELYNNLRIYGNGYVTDEITDNGEQIPDIQDEIKKLIEAVWDEYKHLTASQLVSLTHEINTPWSKTWYEKKYSVIKNDTIRRYYEKVIASAVAHE